MARTGERQPSRSHGVSGACGSTFCMRGPTPSRDAAPQGREGQGGPMIRWRRSKGGPLMSRTPDLWRGALLLLSVLAFPLLFPLTAGAAPAGKVVIAQGVDPSTLDMMNQSEQPASNVGAQMFDMLVARDQSLTLVPELAAELPKLVAPTTWEIKLRRGVKFHNGEDFDAEVARYI